MCVRPSLFLAYHSPSKSLTFKKVSKSLMKANTGTFFGKEKFFRALPLISHELVRSSLHTPKKRIIFLKIRDRLLFEKLCFSLISLQKKWILSQSLFKDTQRVIFLKWPRHHKVTTFFQAKMSALALALHYLGSATNTSVENRI